MPKRYNIAGNRYGRWTVIKENGRTKNGGVLWLCRCDCGVERNVDGRSLRNGLSNSCGCLGAEHRLRAAADAVRTHGGKHERLYCVWQGILDRCRNPNNKFYSRYGGRGIDICSEWEDYAVFRQWAFQSGYNPNAKRGECTIDRIDNDGGYDPGNCRWAPSATQCNNRSNNHIITFDGVSKTLSEWALSTGIRKDTLRRRIVNYGWSVEKALTTPVKH